MKDGHVEHDQISNKFAHNMLLLIMYLYCLRVIHHELVSDIMSDIISLAASWSKLPESSTACENLLELLVYLLDTVGSQLKADDPEAVQVTVTAILDFVKASSMRESKRFEYMMETITDLKSSKSKRKQSTMIEKVGKLRKWLGHVKTSLGAKPGDLCLHITLNDFLEAETNGRWWRAGAAWAGRTTAPDKSSNDSRERREVSSSTYEPKTSNISGGEHTKLLAMATKMRMNTPVRRDVFVVMMSSMDAMDAFERLQRLDLKGKQDREIIRVLIECCGQEKTYNTFYADLACIMCEHNRQHKSTLQYAYWDAFKTLSEDNFTDRRAINLSRMLGALIIGFHLSLSILKVIDMSELSERMVLFMATLFLSIFSSKVNMILLRCYEYVGNLFFVISGIRRYIQYHFR